MFARRGMFSAALAATFAVACLGVNLGCGQRSDVKVTPVDPSTTVELTFTYGSEKEAWLDDVNKTFNTGQHKTKSGKTVLVRGAAVGSGELVDEALKGRRKPHLISPASAAYLELGNAEAKAMNAKPLVDLGKTKNLVMSPVVIAMWKPMAEALGWPTKEIGWADVHKLASDPRGWEAAGKGQWGPFKFAHTHPEYSNSGLISALAEVYAGAGKTRIDMDDVKNPKVAEYLRTIERSVVHYGSSTGFFGKRMFANPMTYLNAAVLYENMVIESYSAKQRPAQPVVAIYPKEGTFWADHPVAVVDREWVSDEQREAAELYIDFLMGRPQQEKAMAFGFRPGDEKVDMKSPLDEAHGIDPKQPKLVLRVPEAGVMKEILTLWRANKKPSRIALVMDVSGSMNRDQRLVNAKDGAMELVKMLGENDRLSLMTFSTRSSWVKEDVKMDAAGKKDMEATINSLIAQGETALYDAIDTAYDKMLKTPDEGAVTALVVLTDGEDNRSKMKLDELVSRVTSDFETRNIRVFTIAYGGEADRRILQRIAEAAQAKSYSSDPRQIFEVFKDIATFF
jgi:Ca-activated chloride channel family protein